MLEPPNLPAAALLAALHDHYGLAAASLTFLPLGNDTRSWVYRAATADGSDYFLKLRGGPLNPASLAVPRFLHDRGVINVIAPLPTQAGALSVAASNEFSLILYPYIEGRVGAHGGLTRAQWVEYGAAFRLIHASTPTPALAALLRREAFAPKWAPVAEQIDAMIDGRRFDDPAQQGLAGFWRAQRARIQALLARAAKIGRRLRAAHLPQVLCHADAHLWNILVEPGGALWVVDWDDTLLAPKECDLLFVAGGGIGRDLVKPHETELFLEGYSDGGAPTPIDALALAYYRHERAIGDIGGYGEAVFLAPDTGDATRRGAVDGFMRLFGPDGIVDMALGADLAGLPELP